MIAIFIVNSLVVALAVVIHYECLIRLAAVTPKLRLRHRSRLLVVVFGALIAHVIEVWLFACVYYLMAKTEGWGGFTGNSSGTLMDCADFSFTTYTTLGFGDIEPIGVLRYLTGIEALTGLVLITWTASFLYIEMQRFWPSR